MVAMAGIVAIAAMVAIVAVVLAAVIVEAYRLATIATISTIPAIATIAAIAAIAAIAFASPRRLHAQTVPASCNETGALQLYDLTDPTSVLARALSVTRHGSERGSGIFRSAVRTVNVCHDSVPFLRNWTRAPKAGGVRSAVARGGMVGNSAYPRSVNDGLLWAGKGVNTVATAGLHAEWRSLSAALLPTFAFQGNANHDYVRASWEGRSPFAHPDHSGIDLPKRFGSESFTRVHPGQSFIRAAYGPVGATISTENLWLGAAQVYPILLSNTAPGFPHVRLGTVRPLNLFVLDVELNVFWGSVSESDYFDGNPDNNSHFFTGTALIIQPHFLPGLHVGFARVYHDTLKATGQKIDFYLDHVIESPLFTSGGNRPGNAIGGLFFRWVLPESGFEVYGEWTREDTPYNLEDILREPDWTTAYATGLQKVFVSRARLTRVYGELIHLGASAATVRTVRGPFTTYTHNQPPHGHTNRGQILGSATGPGSDAQRIGVDVVTANAMTGGFIERVRYDDDTYYTAFARRFGEARHDVELTLGLQRLQRLGPVEIHAQATLSRRYDRDFISLRSEAEVMTETNIGTLLMLRWNPAF